MDDAVHIPGYGAYLVLDDMKSAVLEPKTQFALCAQTTIADGLLESLVVNKRRAYPNINPITAGGHGRNAEARQLLAFILNAALNIHRLPGCQDIDFNRKFFSKYTQAELCGAISDAQRIYKFSQSEMAKVSGEISLKRGLRQPESSVAATLLDNCSDPVSLPLQTICFFNHACSPFSGDIELHLSMQTSWVWASIYTLSDLELPGSDEEIIVVPRDMGGCINVPKSCFINRSAKLSGIPVKGQKAAYEECLAALFTTKQRLTSELVYLPGWLERTTRSLDQKLGSGASAEIKRGYHVI